MRNISILLLAVLSFFLVPPADSFALESIWELQTVKADGLGTHPLVGADPGPDPATSPNRATIRGIALNATEEYLDPDSLWQIYVQAEPPDQGGIALWAGNFYNPSWPRYPMTIQPGDRIEANGFLMNARGKVNMNERHSAAAGMQFTVSILQAGVGMPEPIVISNLSTCNSFDVTRASGGERYQAQWVRLENIHIVSGTWGAGQTLVVADGEGNMLDMLLSARGDFDSYSAPSGDFHATGIFDQEDLAAPFTDSYRLWVKRRSDLQDLTTSVSDWMHFQ